MGSEVPMGLGGGGRWGPLEGCSAVGGRHIPERGPAGGSRLLARPWWGAPRLGKVGGRGLPLSHPQEVPAASRGGLVPGFGGGRLREAAGGVCLRGGVEAGWPPPNF